MREQTSYLEKSNNEALKIIGEQLQSCTTIREKITKTLYEDAPVNINKGNAIASGVSEELDELRAISTLGKGYLDNMQAREIDRTGISSLKISFNNVFGYY
ncbi:MAG: DNA mismatch repair protein MutS, partial [Bacteroidetes bacterium HGW-Bacteroidetes-3]